MGKMTDIVEEPKQAKYYYSILKDCRAWHNVYIPNGREIYPYSLTSGAYIQSIWDQQKRKPLFQLTDEHRHKGNSILKKIGLPDDAWFVTCHVREPQFKGKEIFAESPSDSVIAAGGRSKEIQIGVGKIEYDFFYDYENPALITPDAYITAISESSPQVRLISAGRREASDTIDSLL